MTGVTTTTEPETLPSEFSWIAHWACPVCHEEPPLVALCGKELIGIRADPGAPCCPDCDLELIPHIEGHVMRGDL